METIKKLLKEEEHNMLKMGEWLKNFKDNKTEEPFKKVGSMFCDGFIISKVIFLYPKQNDF